jgi:hypothetical protein
MNSVDALFKQSIYIFVKKSKKVCTGVFFWIDKYDVAEKQRVRLIKEMINKDKDLEKKYRLIKSIINIDKLVNSQKA